MPLCAAQVQSRGLFGCDQAILNVDVSSAHRLNGCVQVISDFGVFGRAKAESFLSDFEDTYCLKSYTIRGDDIR